MLSIYSGMSLLIFWWVRWNTLDHLSSQLCCKIWKSFKGLASGMSNIDINATSNNFHSTGKRCASDGDNAWLSKRNNKISNNNSSNITNKNNGNISINNNNENKIKIKIKIKNYNYDKKITLWLSERPNRKNLFWRGLTKKIFWKTKSIGQIFQFAHEGLLRSTFKYLDYDRVMKSRLIFQVTSKAVTIKYFGS